MSDYEELMPNMKLIFDKVYKKHLAVMGVTEQERHTMDHISKIKVNVLESCFEVHFSHGEWYKYFSNGTWG